MLPCGDALLLVNLHLLRDQQTVFGCGWVQLGHLS